MTKQVFISYRRKQGNVPREVKELKEVLTRNGYTVFLDKHELRGKWKDEIMRAIKNCGLFVFVLTEDDALEEKVDAGGNDVVYEEIRIAKKNNKDIRLVSYLSTEHTEQALKCENDTSKKYIIDILNNNQHLPELSSDNENILNAQYQYFLRFLSDIIKPILTDIQSEIVKNIENGTDVTFYTDADCLIFENNKILDELSADDCKAIKFKKGIHRLRFQSKESKDIYYLQNITIGDDVQVYDIKLKEKLLDFYFEQGNKKLNDGQHKDAVIWYHKAAEKGNAEAQYHLGECYYHGKGIEQNYKQAADLFCEAAKQELAEAQFRLGECYYHGKGIEQNYKQATDWYRKAAEKKLAEAQYKLGFCYYYRKGVSQNHEQAFYWYKLAAEQGHPLAQFKLGDSYFKGKGIEQNHKKATDWYRKAAEKGNNEAQCKLGLCYRRGFGVPQSYKQAAIWYQKAAENGNCKAQYILGYFFEKGKVGEQNYKRAAYWYELAAKNGDKDAIERLKKLGVDLS